MKSRLGVRTSLDARANDGAMDGWARARVIRGFARRGERRRRTATVRRGRFTTREARTNERTRERFDSIPFHSIDWIRKKMFARSRERTTRGRARGARGALGAVVTMLAMARARGARGEGAVVTLDVDAFETRVTRSREPWVVSFTGSSEKCAICGEVSREFEKAARGAGEKLRVNFGSLDVTREGVDLERLGRLTRLTTIPAVSAYPTFATLNPYDARRSAKMPVNYPISREDGQVGDVRAKAFAAFAENALPTHLVNRASATEDAERFASAASIRAAFGGDVTLPIAVLLTNKPSTSALLKSISHALEGRVRFIEAVYEGDVAPQLPGAPEDARLVVYPTDVSATPIPFESASMKREVVLEFLTEHAGPEVELKMETIDATPKKDGQKQDFSTSLFKPALAKDFETDVLSNHKRIQVVAFTKASDECVELVDALPKSFHEYEGVFDFREVIARDDDEAARALVTKFGLFKSKDKCAELVMFPSTDDEDDDRDPIVFKPSVATIEGFAPDAVGRFFLDNVVDTTIPVTAKNIDSALFGVASMAPKVLLFADESDETSRKVLHLMSAVQKDFIYGVTSDTSEALTEQFQIKTRPALVVVYREADKNSDEEGGMRMSVQKYPVEQLMTPIVNSWLQQIRDHVIGVDKDALVSMPMTVDTSAALDEQCAAKGGLCVVAFIKDDNAEHKKIIHAVAKALYGKPYHFAIVDPTKQRTFSSVFDVNNPVDYPTVTVLAMRTSRYATHKGAFDEIAVRDFCTDILGGKVKTWRFQEMPKLVEGGETVEEIVEEEIVEEEFDLSDIMSEEVEGEAALSREDLAQRAQEELETQARLDAILAEEAKLKEEAAKKAKKRRRKKKKSKKSEL